MTDWTRIEKLIAEWNHYGREIENQIEILMLYDEKPGLEHRLRMVESMNGAKKNMDQILRELWGSDAAQPPQS